MTHSEWSCNICEEGFETRGRRDGYRQRAHRQKAMIGIDERGVVRRSEDGKFKCGCGRDYMSAQSLQRHRRNCRDDVIISNEIGDDDDDDDDDGDAEEGAYQ